MESYTDALEKHEFGARLAEDKLYKQPGTLLTWREGDNKTVLVVDGERIEVSSAKELVEALVPQICRVMEQAAELDVPLIVEAGVGDNWDEAH